MRCCLGELEVARPSTGASGTAGLDNGQQSVTGEKCFPISKLELDSTVFSSFERERRADVCRVTLLLPARAHPVTSTVAASPCLPPPPPLCLPAFLPMPRLPWFDIKTTRCGPKGRSALRFAFVILMTALVHRTAACPNKCMGRGICNVHDQCECMLGYQGTDCSEMSCPMGKAWTGYVATTARGKSKRAERTSEGGEREREREREREAVRNLRPGPLMCTVLWCGCAKGAVLCGGDTESERSVYDGVGV